MRESAEKTEYSDKETKDINCQSSTKFVCERTDNYSTEKETQKNHGRRYRHVDCFVADEIKLKSRNTNNGNGNIFHVYLFKRALQFNLGVRSNVSM